MNSFSLKKWNIDSHHFRGLYQSSPICIVQSLEAAIHMDYVNPNFVWLAANTGDGLSRYSLLRLQSYLVLLIPPIGSEDIWSQCSTGISNIKIIDWSRMIWEEDLIDWEGCEVSDLFHPDNPSISELNAIILEHVDKYFNNQKTEL